MADRTVSVRLTADTTSYQQKMTAAGTATKAVGREVTGVGGAATKAGGDMDRATVDMSKGLARAEAKAGDLRVAVGRVDLGSLGGAAVAAGVAGVAGTLDDATTSAGMLRAQLGLTDAEARGFQRTSRDVYRAGFGSDMGEAARLTGMLTQSLGIQGEELENVAGGVFSISDGFGHVGADAQGLTDGLRGMKANFPGFDEAHALDLIAASFQAGTGNSGDLTDTLREYPGFFAQLGLSADDMFGVLNTGFESGIRNTDFTADAIKELGIRVNTLGDTGQEAIRRMFSPEEADRIIGQFGQGGEAARDAFFTLMEQLQATSGEQERYNLAADLFGTKAEDMGAALQPFIASMADARDRTVDVSGATDSLDAQYTGFRNTIELTKRAVQTSLLAPIEELTGVTGGDAVEATVNLGTGFLALKASGVSLGGAVGGLRKGMGSLVGVMGAGGPLLGGLALGAGLLAVWTAEKEAARQATEEYTTAIEADSGALGENTRAQVVNRLEAAGLLADAEMLGISTRLLTDAVMGETGSRQELSRALDEQGGFAENAIGLSLGQWQAMNRVVNVSREEMEAFDASAEATARKSRATAEATAATESQSAATAYAAAETRRLNEAFDFRTAATETQTDADYDLIEATDATTAALDANRAMADRVTATFNLMTGSTLGQERAAVTYQERLASLQESLAEHGASLDITTEKGRTNQTAVHDLVGAIGGHIDALVADGTTMEQLRPIFDAHVEDFRDTMTEAGLTAAEIDGLVETYGLVPSELVTRVATSGVGHAIWETGEFNRALKDVGTTIESLEGHTTVRAGGGSDMIALASGGLRDPRSLLLRGVPST